MTSQSASGGEAALIGHLQQLYDRHRYLDAFALSESYWRTPPDLQQLSTDELLLAGRLAWRLGGPRRSRVLLREAARRNPADARVRLFTSHLRFPGRHLLDDIRSFQERPDLDGGYPEMRAAWYASNAAIWAGMDDLQRAYDCLDRARTLAPDDSWVLSCESVVHGLADRWADAVKSAERAWAVDPGSPFAAVALGTSLLRLGCVEESAARLYVAAGESQSWELVLDACWRQCALAETLEGRERESALDRATQLADRLPLLAPLADRESRAMVARARLDIAALSEDYIQIERWAEEVRSPFHRTLVASLRKNTAGRRIRLPFHRTIQKHDTSGTRRRADTRSPWSASTSGPKRFSYTTHRRFARPSTC